MTNPDTFANQSPHALHVRGSESSHQQIVVNGDKAKGFLLVFALSICILSLFFNVFFAYIFYVEKYADQNRYDWFQRDRLMPLESKVDALDKEMQAIIIKENDDGRRR